MKNMLNKIKAHKFIAILRHVPLKKTAEVSQALYDGGIRIIEVTFDPSDSNTIEKTGCALEIIRGRLGDGVSLGMGTVVKPEYVTAAKSFGAGIIISPNTDAEIIRLTKENGMVSIPGAYTPSEIVSAYNAGADLVKIFPILPDNIAYLRTVMSPLSYIPFITTGGVNADTAGELMMTGAAALAAGASIITPKALAENDYETIKNNAKAHLDAIKAVLEKE